MFGVITLATSKGGVGKSSLGRSLAAHWFGVGHKPALIDADPQRTLANRYDPKGRMGGVPVVAEPEERVGETIAELRQQHAPVIETGQLSAPWSSQILPSFHSSRPSRTWMRRLPLTT